jgi:hypothetical protein
LLLHRRPQDRSGSKAPRFGTIRRGGRARDPTSSPSLQSLADATTAPEGCALEGPGQSGWPQTRRPGSSSRGYCERGGVSSPASSASVRLPQTRIPTLLSQRRTRLRNRRIARSHSGSPLLQIVFEHRELLHRQGSINHNFPIRVVCGLARRGVARLPGGRATPISCALVGNRVRRSRNMRRIRHRARPGRSVTSCATRPARAERHFDESSPTRQRRGDCPHGATHERHDAQPRRLLSHAAAVPPRWRRAGGPHRLRPNQSRSRVS